MISEILNIIIPCFNEQATLGAILGKLEKLDIEGWQKRVIIVDDGSADETGSIAREFVRRNPDWVYERHETNRGKGGAIATAARHVSDGVCVIQDADDEYEPSDLVGLVRKFEEVGGAIYGSRNLRLNPASSPLFYWGGRLTTFVTNLLFGLRLTDMNTCYKMFPAEALRAMNVSSSGFAVDAEITAKLCRLDIPISEVPVTYRPRSREQGKKIVMRDGWRQVVALVALRFRG